MSRPAHLFSAFVAAALFACGSSDDESGGAGTAGTASQAGAGGAAGEGTAGTGTAAGAAGSMPTGPQPKPELLPKPTGPCPDFTKGKNTVSPDGKARDVEVWITDAAQTLDGPLVFYWHGTGSSPTLEPPYAMGTAQIAAITAMGGMVIAPYHDPAAGTYPWFSVSGSSKEDDHRVADEALACAIEKVGVDVRRIHSMGMSAGGLQTSALSWRRSGYLASVVVFSGGQVVMPKDQDPSNAFAAMVFYGGPTDMYGGFGFEQPSKTYLAALKASGRFGFLCTHTKGHSIPTDASASTWQFLSDHPFGTTPSPYASGLPAGMPSYCAL